MGHLLARVAEEATTIFAVLALPESDRLPVNAGFISQLLLGQTGLGSFCLQINARAEIDLISAVVEPSHFITPYSD